jgi:hypothetical protein
MANAHGLMRCTESPTPTTRSLGAALVVGTLSTESRRQKAQVAAAFTRHREVLISRINAVVVISGNKMGD